MAEAARHLDSELLILDDGLPTPDNCLRARVLSVTHYTDNLFEFSVERDPGFRFQAGEFAMLGLPLSDTPFRAYSVASAPWEDHLTFYSIKVPGGPLTEKLQHLQAGDSVLLRRKTTGTLVCDALLPGERLIMLSTGTGVAPFASVALDPAIYDAFGSLALVQGVRVSAELQFARALQQRIESDELIREFAADRFELLTCTSREAGAREGRVTDWLYSGELAAAMGSSGLDPETDRIMICGSMAMLNELKSYVIDAGFVEGSRNRPGTFAVERAFAG